MDIKKAFLDYVNDSQPENEKDIINAGIALKDALKKFEAAEEEYIDRLYKKAWMQGYLAGLKQK